MFLLKQTEEVRGLIRRIELDVPVFHGPKFENWLSNIEPLINLHGLSHKDLKIWLLVRRTASDKSCYPMPSSMRMEILGHFRRVLRWRFRKMRPHQLMLIKDIVTACCWVHIYSRLIAPSFSMGDCYKWYPCYSNYHDKVLRPGRKA